DAGHAAGGDSFLSKHVTVITVGGEASDDDEETETGIRPLSDRLVAELTAHRTLALRDAVGNDPDMAFLSVLHVLCLAAFYRYSRGSSCLEIVATSSGFTAQAPSLKDSSSARSIAERHESWRTHLPE